MGALECCGAEEVLGCGLTGKVEWVEWVEWWEWWMGWKWWKRMVGRRGRLRAGVG